MPRRHAPADAGVQGQTRRPALHAGNMQRVEVAEVEGNPGYYSAKFYLRPHYQLEGLTASLRLVSKLPSPAAG